MARGRRDVLFNVRVSDSELDKHVLKLNRINQAISALKLKQEQWSLRMQEVKARMKALDDSVIKGEITADQYALAIKKLQNEYERLGQSIKSADVRIQSNNATMRKAYDQITKNEEAVSRVNKRYSKFISTAAKVGIVSYMIQRAWQGLEAAAQKVDLENTLTAQIAGFTDQMEQAHRSTANTVSDLDLLKSAALMSSFKIPMDRWGETMGVVSKLAVRTGQSTRYLMDSLATGVSRLSPKIIDNLGIQIDMNATMEEYAATLGKTSQELTAVEQRQALLNKVLQEAAETTKGITLSSSRQASLSALSASWQNLKTDVAETTSDILFGIGEFASKLVAAHENTWAVRNASIGLAEDMEKAVAKMKRLEATGQDTSSAVEKLNLLQDQAKLYELYPDLIKDAYSTEEEALQNSIELWGAAAIQRVNGDVDAGKQLEELSLKQEKAAAARLLILNLMRSEREVQRQINENYDLEPLEKKKVLLSLHRETQSKINNLAENYNNVSLESLQIQNSSNDIVYNMLFRLEEVLEFQKKIKVEQDKQNAAAKQLLDTVNQTTIAQERLLDVLKGSSADALALVENQREVTKLSRENSELSKKLEEERDNEKRKRISQELKDNAAAFEAAKKRETQIRGRIELSRVEMDLEKQKHKQYLEAMTDREKRDKLAELNKEGTIADWTKVAEAGVLQMRKGLEKGSEELIKTGRDLLTQANDEIALRQELTPAQKKGYRRHGREIIQETLIGISYAIDNTSFTRLFRRGARGRLREEVVYYLKDQLTLDGDSLAEIKAGFKGGLFGVFDDVDVWNSIMSDMQKSFGSKMEAFTEGKGLFTKGTSFWSFITGDGLLAEDPAILRQTVDEWDKLIAKYPELKFEIQDAYPELYRQVEVMRDLAGMVAKVSSEFKGLGSALNQIGNAGQTFNLLGDTAMENFRNLSSGANTFAKALQSNTDAYGKLLGAIPLMEAVTKGLVKNRKTQAFIEMWMQAAAAWAAFAEQNYLAAAAHTTAATMYGMIAGGAIKLPGGGKDSDKKAAKGAGGSGKGGDIHVHIYGDAMASEAERGSLIYRALEAAKADGAIP